MVSACDIRSSTKDAEFIIKVLYLRAILLLIHVYFINVRTTQNGHMTGGRYWAGC